MMRGLLIMTNVLKLDMSVQCINLPVSQGQVDRVQDPWRE
jgi:hypothetical protein